HQRQDQLGMNAVRAEQDLDALARLLPLGVAWDRRSDPPRERVGGQSERGTGDDRAESPDQTARRRSHRIDQSPLTSRAARRNPAMRHAVRTAGSCVVSRPARSRWPRGATASAKAPASAISGPARMLAMTRSYGARPASSGWSKPSATTMASSPGLAPSRTALSRAFSSTTGSQTASISLAA